MMLLSSSIYIGSCGIAYRVHASGRGRVHFENIIGGSHHHTSVSFSNLGVTLTFLRS